MQRKEMGTVLARNMEFSQAIIDYQRKLRESSQKLQASEELGHRQSIEVQYFLILSNKRILRGFLEWALRRSTVRDL